MPRKTPARTMKNKKKSTRNRDTQAAAEETAEFVDTASTTTTSDEPMDAVAPTSSTDGTPEPIDPATIDPSELDALAHAAASDDAGNAALPADATSVTAAAASPRAGGLAAGLAGLAAAAALAAPFVPAMATIGMTSGACGVLAAVLFVASRGQRQQANLQQQLAANHESLQRLRAEPAPAMPAAGDELQHLLMSLQRQDEKINNLTKAIKMYGKPLMDIAGQSTELVGAVGRLEQTSAQRAAAAEQAFGKLATHDQFAQVAKQVEAAGGKSPTLSLEPLQQHLSRLEVGLAAVAQRLDSSDVQKSLLRLEEASQKGREAMQELLKGDSVQKATSQLQHCVDAATKGLADGLGQMRDGNLGRLESTVRDIQREVSGVATTIAQINAVMKNGSRVAATSPPPANPGAGSSTPAPTSAESSTAGPAPSATATMAPTPAPAPAGGDATGYQTGARTTGSANVLGAIAKLKKLKG